VHPGHKLTGPKEEEEEEEDHQWGFRRNRSITDHIFCIRQIFLKNGNTTKQCPNSSWTSRKLMFS
jgi:hypothetical protein